MAFGYVHKFANGAKAQVHDVDASYKDLTEICRAIRGKTAPVARRILDEAIAMKTAIPYRDSRKGVGHRSSLGGRKGRYPMKECKIVRDVLTNAVSNAKNKGLDSENLFVAGATANRVNTFGRSKRYYATGITLGYGKQSTRSDYETAKIEIHVLENKKVKPAKKARGKTAAKPAVETKPAGAKTVIPASPPHIPSKK